MTIIKDIESAKLSVASAKTNGFIGSRDNVVAKYYSFDISGVQLDQRHGQAVRNVCYREVKLNMAGDEE